MEIDSTVCFLDLTLAKGQFSLHIYSSTLCVKPKSFVLGSHFAFPFLKTRNFVFCINWYT